MASVRRNQGVVPCCAQPFPDGFSGPTAGHSRVHQQPWWHLLIPYLRKGKNYRTGRRGGEKSNKQECKQQGQKDREELFQAPEQISTLQPMEDPTPEQLGILEGTMAH